jgi:Glucodextranase, domain B
MLRRTVFLFFALVTAVLAADPVIGTVTTRPTVAPANTPTQVAITALITDVSLSANGANVQRLNSAGSPTAVLGLLHDDGLNGDATAGDRIFTLVFTLNEPSPTRVFFRATASFQGVVQRVSSSTVAVDIGNAASPLSIDAASTAIPNAAGWNKSDVTVTFSCAGGLGGSESCPGIARVSTEGNAQAISGTATDGAGNNATKSVAVSLDKSPPILVIASPANGAVLPSAAVTVTGTVTDALSGVSTFTCNGQTATVNGSAFSCNLALAPGSNSISLQATDAAGNTATAGLTVTYSASALTISATPSPAPNAAGWNNADVTVAFTCAGGVPPVSCPQSVVISNESANQVISRTATDAVGSTASASVTLKIDKTRPTLAISSPAPAATVTTPQITVNGTAADTLSTLARVTCNNGTALLNGATFSCNLTLTNGPNSITVQATDVAGNTATSNLTVTLGNALTISATPSPAPNAAGWNNADVTVTFTCAGGSGTITCPQPVVVSNEGAGQVISRTATDTSGNTATATVTLKIDKTPPLLTINSPAPGSTVANPQLTILGTSSDALSGIASVTCAGAPATLTQPTFSCGRTLITGLNNVIIQAADAAGNQANVQLSVTLNTPPLTISAIPAPAPNAAGWNNTDVTVTFTCSGGTGGLTCPQPVVVSTEGANQIVSRSVADNSGNSATASVTLRIDKTAPSLTIGSPLSGSTVNTSPLTITGSTADALSGIAAVKCNNSSAALTQSTFSCSVALVSGSNSIVVQAVDIAGNTTTANLTVTFSPGTLTIPLRHHRRPTRPDGTSPTSQSPTPARAASLPSPAPSPS